MDVHDCGIVFDNKHVNSTWLAKHFLDQFRLNPNMDYKGFKEMTTSSKFGHVMDWVFCRTKKKAREMLEGSVSDQYAILDEYCKQLLEKNPGTTAIL